MTATTLSDLLPARFSDDSRVWVYQSSRAFVEKEQHEINEQLFQFYSQWTAHGEPVKGWAGILFGQFIVIMADEREVKVSGCSTDASVRIIKSLERQYEVNFFDRFMITFLRNGKAEMLPLNQVQYAVDKGFINKDTLMFNNIVTNKESLLRDWLVPVHQSWLATRISFTQPEQSVITDSEI